MTLVSIFVNIYIYIYYFVVNLKRYTSIDQYPKYIVPLAKPVQPPVRYWLLCFTLFLCYFQLHSIEKLFRPVIAYIAIDHFLWSLRAPKQTEAILFLLGAFVCKCTSSSTWNERPILCGQDDWACTTLWKNKIK